MDNPHPLAKDNAIVVEALRNPGQTPPFEAVRVLDDIWAPETLPQWMRDAWKAGRVVAAVQDGVPGAAMLTEDGPSFAPPGSWIVREPFGRIFWLAEDAFTHMFGHFDRHTVHVVLRVIPQ